MIGGLAYEVPVIKRVSMGGQVDYVWMKAGEIAVADGVGGSEQADFNFAIWGFSAFITIEH